MRCIDGIVLLWHVTTKFVHINSHSRVYDFTGACWEVVINNYNCFLKDWEYITFWMNWNIVENHFDFKKHCHFLIGICTTTTNECTRLTECADFSFHFFLYSKSESTRLRDKLKSFLEILQFMLVCTRPYAEECVPVWCFLSPLGIVKLAT